MWTETNDHPGVTLTISSVTFPPLNNIFVAEETAFRKQEVERTIVFLQTGNEAFLTGHTFEEKCEQNNKPDAVSTYYLLLL